VFTYVVMSYFVGLILTNHESIIPEYDMIEILCDINQDLAAKIFLSFIIFPLLFFFQELQAISKTGKT